MLTVSSVLATPEAPVARATGAFLLGEVERRPGDDRGMPKKSWTPKDERKYQAILESCVFERGQREVKACKRVAAATVNRDRKRRRQGLGVPPNLEIREVDTGSPRAFEFQAFLGGERVGSISAVRRNVKVGGRVVYAVHDVGVSAEARRKGIATKLYEAAAQEACRRRSRLASIDRLFSSHSRDFWHKQKTKGRVQEYPGKPVPPGIPPEATPIYVLDCAFARDLSGLGEIAYDQNQRCGLPYERFRTKLTFGDGYHWIAHEKNPHGESKPGRPSARRIAREMGKAKRWLFDEYQQGCEPYQAAPPAREGCGPVCDPVKSQPCGDACIPLTRACRTEPKGACTPDEAFGVYQARDLSFDFGDEPDDDAWLAEARAEQEWLARESSDVRRLGDAFAAQGARALRDSAKAEELTARTGNRLTPVPPRRQGLIPYDVIGPDGEEVGSLVLEVGDFTDEVDDEGFDSREGLLVHSIELHPRAQGKRIGTKLYEIAAEIACNYDLPLVSDRLRSRFAEAFWRKQLAKGRAYAVTGQGAGLYDHPRVEAEEAIYAAALAEGLERRGVRREIDLDSDARGAVVEEAMQVVDVWRAKLPEPLPDGSWAVERYVLDDTCGKGRDLSGLRRAAARRRRR